MKGDVPCVQIYRTIRENVPSHARRLGIGRNLFPPAPALLRHLETAFSALGAQGRLSNYTSDEDERERELLAWLIERYLGGPRVPREAIFLTTGAQEAISLVATFAARKRLSSLLPLPLYYSFEQSSARWGVPVAGHYRYDGQCFWHDAPQDLLLRVSVLPNGVTGTLFAPPRGGSARVALSLVDCVFQMGGHVQAPLLAEAAREAVRQEGFERTALIFTASKDLSLPGLRAGLLVSGNTELLRFADEDRFERYYSLNPLVSQVMLAYFTVLTVLTSGWGVYDEVRRAFLSLAVPVMTEDVLREVLAHVDAMTQRNRENLARLLRHPLLELGGEQAPVAGYSLLPRVRRPFRDGADFIAWVHRAGTEHELKLNPTLLFGATQAVWDELYPGEHRIRVNVSDTPEELELTLTRLVSAAHAGC